MKVLTSTHHKMNTIWIIFALISPKIVSLPTSKNYTLHEFKDYTGKTQIELTSQGDAILKNAIHSHAGVSNVYDMAVRRNLNVQNSIHSDGHISTGSEITAQQLKVHSHINANTANFEGVLQVNDNVTAKSNIRVQGDITAVKNLSVQRGHLLVGSEIILNSNGNARTRFLNNTGDIQVGGNIKSHGDTMTLGKVISEAGFHTKEGLVTAKDIEIRDSLRVVGAQGKIEAKNAEFTVQISAIELNSKKAVTNSMKILHNLDLDKKSKLHARGDVTMDGIVQFSNGFKSLSHVKIDGDLNVKNDLFAKKLTVAEIEPTVINFKRKKKKSIFIDVVGGTIQADEIVSMNSIETGTLTCTSDIKTSGDLVAKSIVSSSTVQGRELHVLQNSKLNQVDSNLIHINKTLTVEGQTYIDSIKVHKDCSVNGHLSAQTISVSDIVKASILQASGYISADFVQTKKNITTNGNMRSSQMEISGSLHVGRKVTATDLNVTKTFWSRDISSSRVTVLDVLLSKGDIDIRGNASISNSINVRGNGHIGGGLRIKGNFEANNIVAAGSLR